jgi:hypothetical protein
MTDSRILSFGLPSIVSVLLAVAALGAGVASANGGGPAQPKAAHDSQPRVSADVAGVLYLISEHVPSCASLAKERNTRTYQRDDCGFYVGLARQYDANAAKGGAGFCHYSWYLVGTGNVVGLAGGLAGKLLTASSPYLAISAFLFAEGTWYFCH